MPGSLLVAWKLDKDKKYSSNIPQNGKLYFLHCNVLISEFQRCCLADLVSLVSFLHIVSRKNS